MGQKQGAKAAWETVQSVFGHHNNPGMCVLMGYRGLTNEIRKVASGSALENVDGHDKNFGFHSFGLGGP